MSPARESVIGVVFDGALAHTVGRWGAGSLFVRWRTRPVSERLLLQDVYDFLDSHGLPKRTGDAWTSGETAWGQDILSALELCPPHQKSLTNLVELLEPPPSSPLRGPVGTRVVVRMPSPQIDS